MEHGQRASSLRRALTAETREHPKQVANRTRAAWRGPVEEEDEASDID
jgi:hypothetical protein